MEIIERRTKVERLALACEAEIRVRDILSLMTGTQSGRKVYDLYKVTR